MTKKEKREIIAVINNIRRFDEKEKGVDYFAGWDHALDIVKSDLVKYLNGDEI